MFFNRVNSFKLNFDIDDRELFCVIFFLLIYVKGDEVILVNFLCEFKYRLVYFGVYEK